MTFNGTTNKQLVVTLPAEVTLPHRLPRRAKQTSAPTFLCTVERWPLNSAAAVGLPSGMIMSWAPVAMCRRTMPGRSGLLPPGHSCQQEELFNYIFVRSGAQYWERVHYLFLSCGALMPVLVFPQASPAFWRSGSAC